MHTPRPFAGGHLVIRSPQATGHTTRVWLNGQEITHCLEGVVVRFGDDQLTRAELRITPAAIDIDAQTVAALTALVQSEEQRHAAE